MDKKLIIAVDDDPFFGDLYKAALEPKGFEVVWAQDAAEGYAACERSKPALIILDVMMPEKGGFKDGFDLLERLRKGGNCAKTPVIMISAIGGPEDVRHGLELGANAYLAKQDMVPDTLMEQVRKLTA
ncbi:MAG TPA: response regulator [Candidatus Binatia bacterium]|jgi:DNA-binding response OmpR family regulator|nr:response regulator [Candidatus Binatia bacterium]